MRYTLRESADMIGIKVRTIREWLKKGKIKATQDERTHRWYVEEDEITRCLHDGNKD